MRACTAPPARASGPRASWWTASAPTAAGRSTPAKEEAYFFKMSKYAPRLIEYINEHPEFIQPVATEKTRMMNNFLLPGPAGFVRVPHQLYLGHPRGVLTPSTWCTCGWTR